jgi:hypothetical protein
MARVEVRTLVDDVDGAEATETVTFALDGVGFELDLSEQNARALRETLQGWVRHARRTGGRQVRGTGPHTS